MLLFVLVYQYKPDTSLVLLSMLPVARELTFFGRAMSELFFSLSMWNSCLQPWVMLRD